MGADVNFVQIMIPGRGGGGSFYIGINREKLMKFFINKIHSTIKVV